MTDRRWRPPAPESIIINPCDHAWLTRQLPQATLYGEPIPDSTPVLQNHTVSPGTVAISINGKLINIPFAPHGHGTQWRLPEPYPHGADTTAPEAT